MNSEDVLHAVAASTAALRAVEAAEWDRPAGLLTWSAYETAAHIGDDLLAYAMQVAGSPTDRYLPVEYRMEPGASAADHIAVIEGAGDILAAIVSFAPATRRAWHPFGTADPGGFAAMGILEVLVHTWDIRAGTGQPWMIPTGLSARVLARLFPELEAGPDPADQLLWATGRATDPQLGRRESWRWDSSVRRSP